jgi:hypothetical protein
VYQKSHILTSRVKIEQPWRRKIEYKKKQKEIEKRKTNGRG